MDMGERYRLEAWMSPGQCTNHCLDKCICHTGCRSTNAGKVEYIGEVTPELVIVDYDLIRMPLNIAGCGDIFLIQTASV